MRAIQRLTACLFTLLITGSLMSFQLYTGKGDQSNNDLKVEVVSVRISKFTSPDGQAVLVAHHPRNMNLNFYSGSNYEVSWYTGRGEPIASNTTQIAYECGSSVIVIVKKRFSPLSGGDSYTADPCKSGYQPNGPIYLHPEQ
ncbi:MAG: hypothetical protein AAF502_23855 [Bacteroidota bacterium]